MTFRGPEGPLFHQNPGRKCGQQSAKAAGAWAKYLRIVEKALSKNKWCKDLHDLTCVDINDEDVRDVAAAALQRGAGTVGKDVESTGFPGHLS